MQNDRWKFSVSNFLTSAVAIVLYNLIIVAMVVKSMACKVYDVMNINVVQILMGMILELHLLSNTF